MAFEERLSIGEREGGVEGKANKRTACTLSIPGAWTFWEERKGGTEEMEEK